MRKLSPDPVVWVVGLFAANFLLQRLSIPNLSIPVITPLIVIWMALALWAGVVELNARRLVLWLLAAAVSAGLVILQVLFVSNPFVSINSWAFWIVIWLPLVVQLRDRSRDSYRRALSGIGHLGVAIGALSLLFMGSQLVGIRYHDWLADIVPPSLLVEGYVISYPIVWGSELYKSNAWIALEPSFLSFMLGICVVAAVIARLHWAKVMVIFLGMLTTTAGSGLAVVGAFVVLAVLTGQRARLRSYALPGILLGAVFASTLLGQSILDRVTEAGSSRSSTSLRAIEPYLYLWPEWISDPLAPLLGRGPGSSAWEVTSLGIDGLLVPSPAKMLFDYGVVGGTLLIMVMVSAFVRAPEPLFAAALAISIFTIQAASPPLVVAVMVAVSLWSPTVRQRAARGAGDLSADRAEIVPVQRRSLRVAA
jgi:hypothetical protein